MIYSVLITFALLPVIGFATTITNLVFGEALYRVSGYELLADNNLLNKLIMFALIPALCEELLFRGLLLDMKIGKSIHKIAVLNGVMFSLFHLITHQLLIAFLVGIVLAYITILSGSILPAIIIHFSNNAFAIIITHLKSNEIETVSQVVGVGNLIFSIFLSSVSVIFILIMLDKIYKRYNYDDGKRIQSTEDRLVYETEMNLLTYLLVLLYAVYVVCFNVIVSIM